MPDRKHDERISDLISGLDRLDQPACRRVADTLMELGYMPQREKVRGFVLSFRNRQVRQTIAKIGLRGDGSRALVSAKFYACKNPPPKFTDAVMSAVLSSNLQYRCCGCGVCGAAPEDRGYRCRLPGGEEFVRCGAYVVPIHDLREEDLEDLIRLLREQHEYFLTRKSE